MKNKGFDLTLNTWGPYNKEYLGVCHVAEPALGASFCVELFPGLSTPVLMFFASYYTPGTLTVGFETMVTAKKAGTQKKHPSRSRQAAEEKRQRR